MRRILATILCAIFRFLKIKSDSDKRVSLCKPVAQEATKRHIFHQNDFVCNVCGKQFMAENALYDHNWDVCTLSICCQNNRVREGCRKKKPYFLWSFYGKKNYPYFFLEIESMIHKTNFTLGPIEKSIFFVQL